MMKTKLLNFRLLAIAMACLSCALSASAYDFYTGGIYYTKLASNTVEVAYNTYITPDYSGDVIIPSTVTYGGVTYTVKGIGYCAFGECTQLTSVTLPSTLTYVGELAFIRCSALTSITIPTGVTWIGSDAFEYCSALASVNLPTTLKTIGNNTFLACTALESITLPASLESIGIGAFNRCNNMEYVFSSAFTPPTLGNNAFDDNTLNNATLVINNAYCKYMYGHTPGWSDFANVYAVNSYNFVDNGVYYCQNGVNTVAVSAQDEYYNTYSGEVTIPSTVTYNNKTYTVTEVGPNAFLNCFSLTKVTLPPTVNKICDYGFDNCASLKSVAIPSNSTLTEIGKNAFYGTGLLSVYTILPQSLTTIGDYAFSSCQHLREITIPDNVTSIGTAAFANSGLWTVYIGKRCASIGDYAFGECTELDKVYCYATTPPNITVTTFRNTNGWTTADLYLLFSPFEAYQSSNYWTLFTSIIRMGYDFKEDDIYYQYTGGNTVGVGKLNSDPYRGTVTIPSQVTHDGTTYSVTSITYRAFFECNYLWEITIPPSVTYIGEMAFWECTGLRRVNISSIASWLRITFDGSTACNPLRYANDLYVSNAKLTDLTIPSEISTIKDFAFNGCTSLTSVTIHDNVTSVGKYAFYGCSNITTLNIGSGMTSMQKKTFADCTNLTAINCRATTPPTIDESTFDQSHYSNTTLTVPFRSLSAYQTADYWKNFSISYRNDFVVNGIYFVIDQYGDALVSNDGTGQYGCYSGTVEIPEQVYYYGDEQWHTVTGIAERAFYRCPYLQHLILPNSIGIIHDEAFMDALMDASNSTITCMALTPPMISPSALDPYYAPEMTLYVPYGTRSAYQAINAWNQFGNIVELNYSFKKNGIYYKITGDGKVSVTYKDGNYNTYSGRVSIPRTVAYGGVNYTVTAIDNVAFFNCPNLTDVVIPETVTAIGNTTFKGCTSLTSITIPNSVTRMGLYAFENCTALNNVVIGSGMTSIGIMAFHGCTALETGTITCLALDPPTINNQNAFDTNHYHNSTLYVPQSACADYQQALYWRDFYDLRELWTLDDALNEDGGTIHFESTSAYPWKVVTDGGGALHYAESGNAGVPNTTSTLTATVTVTEGGATLSFTFQAWGEGNEDDRIYDCCAFAIDGTTRLEYGEYQNDWESYSVDLPAGTHTLKWSYSKDASVDPEGDYFAIDHVTLTPKAAGLLGDVDGDGNVGIADVTLLIDYVLTGNSTGVNLDVSNVDDDNIIGIADVTAIIDYILTGTW